MSAIHPASANGAIEDDVYRYLLWREVNPLFGHGLVVFLMLNPSDANAVKNDPTMGRVISFSTGFGFRRVEVVNLFAYRSKDPPVLGHVPDPVGPKNDDMTRKAVARADTVVVAWGSRLTTKAFFRERRAIVLELLGSVPLFCLGTAVSGDPLHPLYLPGTTALSPYSPPKDHR